VLTAYHLHAIGLGDRLTGQNIFRPPWATAVVRPKDKTIAERRGKAKAAIGSSASRVLATRQGTRGSAVRACAPHRPLAEAINVGGFARPCRSHRHPQRLVAESDGANSRSGIISLILRHLNATGTVHARVSRRASRFGFRLCDPGTETALPRITPIPSPQIGMGSGEPGTDTVLLSRLPIHPRGDGKGGPCSYPPDSSTNVFGQTPR